MTNKVSKYLIVYGVSMMIVGHALFNSLFRFYWLMVLAGIGIYIFCTFRTLKMIEEEIDEYKRS